MKKLIFAIIGLAILSSCNTLQSIVRSNLPYTATLIIPATTSTGTTRSAVSQASSMSQIFGSGNTNTKEVRIASARIEASNPSNQSLGVFSSVRLYLAKGDGSGEVLVASRNDIASTVGNSVVLDIDNSRFLDEIINTNSAIVRMEYVLRSQLPVDVSVRATLNFTSAAVQ